MKIKNKNKLNELRRLLLECLDLSNDVLSIDDNEIGTDIDVYRQIADVLDNLSDIIKNN